jgi:hydrophobic/amphiphilic exporter-1 (mainly G- bacteria), HAE1 family
VARSGSRTCRGVGSVARWSARVKREINIYLRPAAMEALGVTGRRRSLSRCAPKTSDLPAGRLRSRESASGWCRSTRAVKRPGELNATSSWRRGRPMQRAGASCSRWPTWSTAREEIETLALYNGQRTLALDVQKSQGENTIEVVDGLNAAGTRKRAAAPGVALEVNRDNSRADPRVGGQRQAHAARGRGAHRGHRLPVPQQPGARPSSPG